jgi:sodium transport system permease protein
MSNPFWIIARKEIVEATRDRRSLASSLLYMLMGPFIVGLITFTRSSMANTAESGTLLALSLLFLLLSSFTGGMNIAMDTMAGERERRSLLPLLMNPISTKQLVVGKWISINVFCLLSLILNFLGFAVVLNHVVSGSFAALRLHHVVLFILTMIPLTMLTAAAELAVSTVCKSVKEAHTWLAFLIFLPMGLGMLIAFHPIPPGEWTYTVPLLGQQIFLSRLATGTMPPLSHGVLLCTVTIIGTIVLLRITSRVLHKDDVLYGN